MTRSAKQFAREWFGGLGRGALLCRDIFSSLFKVKPVWRDVLYQMYFIGVKSQSVVTITGAFTGMVLCAQTELEFHKVKMDTATLAVVSVGMVSELGPVLTSLMVAGRVGAAEPRPLPHDGSSAAAVADPQSPPEPLATGVDAGYGAPRIPRPR